jgi:cytochrome c oxidase cbb3-type subunit III
MSDFSGEFWAVYVGLITLVSILACAVLLHTYSARRVSRTGQDDTTGHVWDEDLREWNNPLPRWWMWMFYITIGFSLIYLALYPGLGVYDGAFRWSATQQYEDEQAQARQQYGPIFDAYLRQDIKTIAADPAARAAGQRLFLAHCAQCHGSDAGGGTGFPNLRDNDWLYGGEPEAIKASITNGRNGVMPPMGGAVGGEDGAKDVANYVLSLSGRTHDELRAVRGKSKFGTTCAACHGADGRGNQTLGAPNLTDGIWIYGGSQAALVTTIMNGRGTNMAADGVSVMPAHKNLLDEAKIHLLTAYVYGLWSQAQK